MAEKIIIDSTTRIIRAVTTDASPVLAQNEVAVDVAFHPVLSKEFQKLMPDNQTIVDSTQQEQSDYLDAMQPKRVQLRALLAHLQDMSNDVVIVGKVRDLAAKLRDFLSP